MLIFVVLGIISSIFQLTLLREFTFSIAKNELSFVVAVGIWFMFGSLGSMLGTRRKHIKTQPLGVLLCVIFCLSIVFIHLAKQAVGLNYFEAAHIVFVIVSGIILIGPLSCGIGYCFCSLSRLYLEKHPRSRRTHAAFFAYEAIGFFIGGGLFAFVLCEYTNPFYFSLLPCAFVLFGDAGGRRKLSLSLSICLLGLFFVASHTLLLEREFKGATILLQKGSRYGPLIVTRQFGVEATYWSGSLIGSSEDNQWHEEFIHATFSACEDFNNVLFIGPVFSGHIREIQKYNVRSLTCVNTDAAIFTLTQSQLSDANQRNTRFIVDDPRSFITQDTGRYDCIIMNIGPPASLATNRYFTKEFFARIKARLEDRGIFSFYTPSKRDILSPAYQRFNSCIINSLDSVFKHRLIVPHDSMIILASSSAPVDEARLITSFTQRAISTEYLSVYHLEDSLDPGRRLYIENMIDASIAVNQDSNPQAFLYYNLLEQTKFYPELSLNMKSLRLAVIILFCVLVCVSAGLKRIKQRRFLLLDASAIGFVSISMTTILFVLFQIFSGALFWKVGMLVGMFMIGLSTGTFITNRAIENLKRIQPAFTALYCLWALLIGGLLLGIGNFEAFFVFDSCFYTLSFLGGSITGAMYPLVSRSLLEINPAPRAIAPAVYCADLLGASLGTIICSLFLIPLLGIQMTLVLLLGAVGIFLLCSFVSN